MNDNIIVFKDEGRMNDNVIVFKDEEFPSNTSSIIGTS